MQALPPFAAELAAAPDLSHLVTSHLFESVPHVFGGDSEQWWQWKTELAEDLEVDAYSVLLVGSAAVGMSLNPQKNGKPFDEGSDIDIAVVSTRHFEIAWYWLRNLGARRFRLPQRVQVDVKDHAPTYVYFGAIATDRILPHLDFGPQWVKALDRASHRDPTADRSVKIRLYRDIAALRSYQVRSIRKAREALEGRGADDA